MNLRLSFIGLAIMLLFSGCDLFEAPKERYISKMLGTWDITELNHISILQNGTTQTLLRQENAGTFVAFKGPVCGEGLGGALTYCNDFTYNGPISGPIRAVPMPRQGSFSVDAAAKRVIFILSECSSLIGCDRAWTVEKNTAQEQVWSYYKVGPNEVYTDKLTLKMQKQ
ncbi:MAG TPA: hypothetical protein PLO56_06695 [Rhodothermales bacterium]|nr:hypothetical protein [Rhodothermales bacterium]